MPFDIALYADVLLLMAALGLALYCLTLQRQIQRLQRTDRGVGKAIIDMTAATRLSQQASDDLRRQISEALHDMDDKLGEVRKRRREVDDVLDAMDGQISHQVRRCDEARALTERALTPLVQKAELEIQAITAALEVSARLSRKVPREEPEPPRPSAEALADNPFLRAVGA